MIWFKKEKLNIPPGGCVPSPLDKRDVLMSEIYPLPVRIAPEMPPPFDLTELDQNGYPHCVGYGGGTVKEEKELRERIRKIFDGDWNYWECKKIDGYDGPGTYLRIMLKVFQKIGAKPLNQPESEAIKYRIGGYAKVDDLTFEGIKKAIYVNGALLAGFIGSNQGWQTAYIRPPKLGETTWGHAVALIGYTKDYLIGQNSWGKNWGDNGKFYIPKDYMPFEAWAILTDYPTEALEFKEAKGWTALEYLKPAGYRVGDIVVPTVNNLRLRYEPMGKILGYVPQKECQILEIGPKKDGWTWVKIGF